MCGIAGIITSRPCELKRPNVLHMMDLLARRGPDDEGIYETDEACLGHRRLAIIDLSAAGHQPMVDGNNAVVFNGEIYNHNALRTEMEADGVIFHSRSDTEVLLRGYRVWGEDVVLRLKGMFAFALWDGERHALFCARDPFGKKPFYFYWGKGRFVFASEVEPVVVGLDSRPNPDYQGLSHYLLKGYFAPGRSVYETIDTLQAGHCLRLDLKNGQLRQWSYWHCRFELGRTSASGYKQATAQCTDLISSAVRRRFESDVSVGVLLSGGVDSSLISLVSSELLQSPIQTFTATFRGTEFDESRFASQVALRARSNHTEIDVPMAGVQTLLPRLIEVYWEPFGDYSAIPTFCLFEAIKPHLKVILTGDGGDEVFAGYKGIKLFLFRAALLPFLGVAGVLGDCTSDRLIYSRWRKIRELGYAIIALRPDGGPVFYSLHRDGWMRLWRQQLMRPEAWRQTGEAILEEEEVSRFKSSGQTDLERYLNLSLERLTQAFLVKIDRASMAHSVEVRCPMLDVDLFQWASGLPKSVLLRCGEPKAILKALLEDRMGRRFATRTKMGFTPPLGKWFRQGDTARWLEKRLTAKDSFAYTLFPSEAIRRLINLHSIGFDHAGRLWNLLFLTEWHRRVYGGSRTVDRDQWR